VNSEKCSLEASRLQLSRLSGIRCVTKYAARRNMQPNPTEPNLTPSEFHLHNNELDDP